MSAETLRVPNDWLLDEVLIQKTKAAVLAIRAEHEYGPRNRERLVFRASELGDVVNYIDAKGELGGCHRKPFYSFWPEKFAARELNADTLMNFAEGEAAEETMARRLTKAGILAERQILLGAWPKGGRVGARADARFPDKSGGLIRGKCDFTVLHPEHGVIPLEWKSSSSYIFDMLRRQGPKGDNALQAQFYGYEMGTSHTGLGYVNKETGQVQIFAAPVNHELILRVHSIATGLRRLIVAGALPDAPPGARAAREANPPGSRRSGFKKLPDGAYYDRAWPCYTYSVKKDRVSACPYYEHCHGALPEKGARAKPARANPLLAKKLVDQSIEFEA